jgi:cell division protein FtsL
MNANHARKWESITSATGPKKEKQVVVKVRKQSWITKGEKILYSIVGVFLILACAYIVSYSSATYTLNKDLQSLENTVVSQQEANELLLFEVEKLSLPERITKIAKDNGLKIQDAEIKHAQGFNN